jgi:hypothetical protein
MPDLRAPAMEGKAGFASGVPPSSTLTPPSKSTGGKINAGFGAYSVGLGTFSAARRARRKSCAQVCRSPHLPAAGAPSPGNRSLGPAARPAVSWNTVGEGATEDQVVIEPQVADYWPAATPLGNSDVLVLSRFACLGGAAARWCWSRRAPLFRICNPGVAVAIASTVHTSASKTAPTAG